MGFKQFDMGEVFSGKASGNMITGWDAPTAATPAPNPNYIMPQWAMDIVAWLRMPTEDREPLYIFGPTGCGKSSCVRQIAAKINMPVYEITGHNRLEFPELVGHHTVVKGNMEFQYGPLALAMRDGGVFLFDEVDACDPSTLIGLNTILDGAPLMVSENGGEIIKAHSEFRIVCTANSNGAGDDTGLYQGVLRMNLAFQDRFIMTRASYMAPDREKDVLTRKFPKLPEDLLTKMVDYANHVRKLFIGATEQDTHIADISTVDLNNDKFKTMQMPITFSTRTLIRWAYLCFTYSPLKSKGVNVIKYSLDRSIGYRADPATRVALHELAQSIFGYKE